MSVLKALVQSKGANNSFHAVRLLAAVQVAYLHAIAHLKLAPTWGYEWISQFSGVPIFFAVSGYLVFGSLLRLPTRRDFFRHRATRIYPALIINIAILETIFGLGGGLHVDAVGPIKALFFEAAYMVTASDELAIRWAGAKAMRSFDGFFQIYPSGVLWTLTVELTFYAAIPLFVFARSRKIVASAAILALSAASIASNGLAEKSLILSLSVVPYFWMFGIGMLFRLWRPPSWSIIPGALAMLAALVFVAWFRDLAWLEWKNAPAPAAMIQTAALCLFVLFLGLSPVLKSSLLAKNDISYGLYLYHMAIVAALMNVPQGERSQWLICAVVAGSALAGYLSWRLVERPAMKRLQNPDDVVDGNQRWELGQPGLRDAAVEAGSRAG